jgi:cyclopropane-fatty-acyl-phospholipid synthase
MALRTTAPLRREIEQAFPERPFSVEFWDGTRVPPTSGNGGGRGVTFTVRSPRALAHVLRAPGQLGLGRAYTAGDLAVDDLDAVMELLDSWKPPTPRPGTQARLALAALRGCGPLLPPRPPDAELRLRGRRHDKERDARAVRHHYDVSNDFFALFLDESMTYSCAIFSRGAQTLEDAQAAKRELICTKLGLQPGQRVLDVGCGWGSFPIHAAVEHGVEVVGITLSEPQAQLARRRAQEAGVGDRVDVRVLDYRDIRGETFDAIASIGMVEHVGEEQVDVYAERLAALLRPGGQLLNHGISRLRHTGSDAGPFSDRYVFPDGDTLHLSRVLLALERGGFVTEHVEGFAPDYAETLRHWIRRLDENLDEAVRLAGADRVRVWRLYLRAARNGFEAGFTSVYQARCRLPGSNERTSATATASP